MSQLINFFVGGTIKVLARGPKRRKMCLTGPLMLSDLERERWIMDGHRTGELLFGNEKRETSHYHNCFQI